MKEFECKYENDLFFFECSFFSFFSLGTDIFVTSRPLL